MKGFDIQNAEGMPWRGAPGFLFAAVLALLLFLAAMPLQAQEAGHPAIEVGVAWQGKSMMPERVLAGMQTAVAEYAQKIRLEIRKELADMADLDRAVSDFEATKKAMVILRSTGAELLGKRGASIPAFIGATNNPVELGAAFAMDKPKPNITGVTYHIPARIKLETFKQVYPGFKNYVLLVEEGHPSSPIDAAETAAAAPELGLTGKTIFCATIEDALVAISRADADAGIIIGSQALLMDSTEKLVEAAGSRPVFAYSERPVEAGALAGMVADDNKLGQMLGRMLIDVLVNGKPVSEIPIQDDPEPRLRLNPKAINKFKSKIPFAIQSLAKTEQMLESILRAAPTGIGVVENRVIVQVNDYILDLTGYTREELLGQSARILYPTREAFDYVRQEKYRQIADHGTGSVETHWLTREGGIRHVILSSTPLNPADPGAGVTFTVLDITDRKMAEAALSSRTRWFLLGLGTFVLVLLGLVARLVVSLRQHRAAQQGLREGEEKYRSILEKIQDGYFEVDIAGNFTFFNDSLCRIMGYSSAELMGKNNREFMDKENAEKVFQAFNQVFETGVPLKAFDWALIRKDGGKSYVDTSVSLIKDAKGKAVGFRGIARDITERKKAESERYALQSQLNHAQKMESVGRLAGGVAHDFNNMLTIINGYAEMMADLLSPSDPMYENVKEIHNAGKRSAVIVRKLLAFARKQIISPVPMNLNESVSSMLKMLHRLIGENVDLLWKPGNNIWLVKMDYGQVDQILANLVVNARDAIADVGKITIESQNIKFDDAYCAVHKGFTPGQYVMLAVSDNGCGMDQHVKDNLFEPFFTTKGVDQGTGLGLPTVYGIIKQNKGFINIYSEVGKGTSVKMYIPRLLEAPEAADREKKAVPVLKGRGETILVLEDDTTVLDITRIMLENLGYTVLAGNTPNNSLSLAEAHVGKIDLLITDIVMPEMNGREFADQLQTLYPDIKVLFMSGYSADVIARHTILEEGLNFIEKPFSIQKLADKVSTLLSAT